MEKDSYLLEIIENNNISEKQKIKFINHHIVSGNILSTNMINELLKNHPKALVTTFEKNDFGECTLFKSIMFSMWSNGVRYEKRFNKQIRELLKSDFKYNWANKDYENYIYEVILGSNITNIILLLDKIKNINSLKPKMLHFASKGDNLFFMKYLIKRKFNFNKYTNHDHKMNWYVNFFRFHSNAPIPYLSIFLNKLSYSSFYSEEFAIEKARNIILNFIKSKNYNKSLRQLKINTIDYLLNKEHFSEIRELFLRIRNDYLKINKGIDPNYFYPQYYYSEIDFMLIYNNLNFNKLNYFIKDPNLVTYFQEDSFSSKDFKSSYVDWFVFIKENLKVSESDCFSLFLKFKQRISEGDGNILKAIINQKNSLFLKNLSDNKIFDILISSNMDEIHEFNTIISEVIVHNNKFPYKKLEFAFTLDYNSIQEMNSVLKLLTGNKSLTYLKENIKFISINDKEIYLGNNQYKIKYLSIWNELIEYIIQFKLGIDMISKIKSCINIELIQANSHKKALIGYNYEKKEIVYQYSEFELNSEELKKRIEGLYEH